MNNAFSVFLISQPPGPKEDRVQEAIAPTHLRGLESRSWVALDEEGEGGEEGMQAA